MEEKRYFVHESSYVDEGCEIGEGTKIWHFSHIMKGCKIGKNCNIGQNVVVSPDVDLGDGCKVQNNVSIYTGVVCEEGVFLGPSCVFTNVVNPRAFIERKREYRKTTLKKGASVGANATIVCGHNVGRYAFVGGRFRGDKGRAGLRHGLRLSRRDPGLRLPMRRTGQVLRFESRLSRLREKISDE